MALIDEAIARASELRSRGDMEGAAAALDAVAHHDRDRVVPLLRELLDELAVTERGIVFRYVPGGSFIMGSSDGDPDEAPPHEVTLPPFWISEGPLSWTDFTRVLGWPDPPNFRLDEEQAKSLPADPKATGLRPGFGYYNDCKIRLQYCENDTLHARNWHAHDVDGRWTHGGKEVTAQELFGAPPRSSASGYGYDQKPMVAVDWGLAAWVGERMSSESALYRLPTEAEWERAARGCLRSAPFPWGDAPPDETRADFNRFKDFSLRPIRAFPPNDYGLFAMAGGVWEWCDDDYDATFYERSPRESPLCRLPETVSHREHVLRGGSWADCADALRTSFRSSGRRGSTPNIGFRLVRVPQRASQR
jgi:formylglycine-generating enzyme